MDWAELLIFSVFFTAISGLAGLSANPPWAVAAFVGGFFCFIIVMRLVMELAMGYITIGVRFRSPVVFTGKK